MKFLKFLWNWMFLKSKSTELVTKDLDNSLFDQITREDPEELEEYSRLQIEKYQALAKCKGREEEVFVLKINNTEVGYYSSLRQLAINNGLNPRSVSNYWKSCNGNPNKNFKEIYEIINYKDFKNENNNI